MVKNEVVDKWYSYDDSYAKEITSEAKLKTEFAYILFYRRKDLARKPLESLYPRISLVPGGGWFRGQPIKLKRKFGSKWFGCLWDVRTDVQLGVTTYHIKFDNIDFFTTLDNIDTESDTDNIGYLV